MLSPPRVMPFAVLLLLPVASSSSKMKGGSAPKLVLQVAAIETSVALDQLVRMKEEVSKGALRLPLPPRLQLLLSLATVSLPGRRPPPLPRRSLSWDVLNTREVETVEEREVAIGKRAVATKVQALLLAVVPISALARVVAAAEMTIAVAAVTARATAVARRNA